MKIGLMKVWLISTAYSRSSKPPSRLNKSVSFHKDFLIWQYVAYVLFLLVGSNICFGDGSSLDSQADEQVTLGNIISLVARHDEGLVTQIYPYVLRCRIISQMRPEGHISMVVISPEVIEGAIRMAKYSASGVSFDNTTFEKLLENIAFEEREGILNGFKRIRLALHDAGYVMGTTAEPTSLVVWLSHPNIDEGSKPSGGEGGVQSPVESGQTVESGEDLAADSGGI